MTIQLANIGWQDDARVFPLLRRYFAAEIPLTEEETEKYFSDHLCRMVRDAAADSFKEWVEEANSWSAQTELSFA